MGAVGLDVRQSLRYNTLMDKVEYRTKEKGVLWLNFYM